MGEYLAIFILNIRDQRPVLIPGFKVLITMNPSYFVCYNYGNFRFSCQIFCAALRTVSHTLLPHDVLICQQLHHRTLKALSIQ